MGMILAPQFIGMMGGAAATSYSYALFTWGTGTGGATGHGDTTHRSVPVQVGVQVDWTGNIACVYQGMLAIKSNGTLWAWGKGNVGQLGLGNSTAYSSPMQVGNDSNWAKVKGGSQFTIATKTDGTLWGWGDGAEGATGHGNTTDYNSPVQIGELTDWSDISAANNRTCVAIKTDGTLWAWGKNDNGQIGDGSAIGRKSPVQVGDLTTWSKAVTEGELTLAINTSGELFAWGINNRGQHGQGDTTARSSPVKVGSLTTWAECHSHGSSTYGRGFGIKTDGTLWGWGDGYAGALGLGNQTDYSSPVQVGSLTDWSKFPIDAELSTAMSVIKTDGTMWTWGNGLVGSLGLGNTTKYSSPVQIGSGDDWSSRSMGGYQQAGLRKINNNAGYALWTWGVGSFGSTGHNDTVARSSPTQLGTLNEWSKYIATVYKGMLGLKVDGTLWAWGKNNDGQLGLGNTTTFSSPMQVGNDGNWAKVKGGTTFTIATKTDGTLWGWGNGNNGATGHGNTTDYSVPIQVGSLTDWSDISVASNYTTVAVKTDGTLWAWGKNDNGQIGDGSTTARSSPVQIGSLTTWSKAVTEGETTLALNTGGEIFGWGRNNRGQAGLGDTVKTSSPVQIGSLTNWADIATMGSSTYGNGFAINTDGELFSWGDGYAGTTGQGNATDYSSPVQVGTLTDWASLPLDTQTTNEMTAIKTDGTLWGWGKNSSGRIGIGNTTKYSSPVQVGSGGGWASSSIGTGLQASLRRPTVADGTTSGYLFASGDNNLSSIPRLGNNNTTDYSTPTQVGTTGSGLKNNWTEVAGYSGGAGVNTAGELWTWGHNSHGQVGDGTTTHRSFPVQVGSLTTWSKVAETGSSFHAIKTDGTLWAWGRNSNGQLGDNTATNRSSPIQVGGLTTWSFINGGAKHFAGIKTDGTLWVNGHGISGELGLGDTAARSSPVQVGSLTDWSKVKMGNGTTAAIKTDGTLWTWGEGGDGQLGDDTAVDRSSPVKVGTLTNWSEIAVCTQSVSAIKTDGTLWTWGNYASGQLGDGSTAKRSSPAQVGTLTDWSKLNVVHNQNAHAAIKTDGTLWMWGMDNSGSIPNGVVQNESSPVQVEHHTDWLMVSGGQNRMWGIRKAYQ